MDIQSITVSGTVNENCIVRQDKNGHEYVIFKVVSESLMRDGSPKYTFYRCFTYNLEFRTLLQGDFVFLTGDLDISEHRDKNGNAWTTNDIFIKNILKTTR